MIFAILIVWIETVDITKFESLRECELVRETLITVHSAFDSRWVRCVEVKE